MRTLRWITVVAVLLSCATAARASQAPKSSGKPVQTAKLPPEPLAKGLVLAQARAEIAGRNITGSAELTERRDGAGTVVEIHLTVVGLSPGLYRVQLHAVGKCDADTDDHPLQMGELPPLDVGTNGRGMLDIVTTRVTLSNGPLSLFDADGSTIFIHANPNQGVTGDARSAISGSRAACGVIQKK